MQNFLISSQSFRDYMEDGRVFWRHLVPIVFEHLDENCECDVQKLIGHTSYETIRKVARMIQFAYAWLKADDQEKKRIEERIILKTKKGNSKRYREHLLRGIKCLKNDGIRNFEDVFRALESLGRPGMPQNQFIFEAYEAVRCRLQEVALRAQDLEIENEELRSKIVALLDEAEETGRVIERHNVRAGQLIREAEDLKGALAREKQTNARLRHLSTLERHHAA